MSTVSVFVNTVSVKANNSKTTKVAVDMIRSIQKVRYGQRRESEVLVLSLGVDKFDMLIILPEDIYKLQAFEKLLKSCEQNYSHYSAKVCYFQ